MKYDIFEVMFATLFFFLSQLKEETEETAARHLPAPGEGSELQLAFLRKAIIFTVLCTEELAPLISLRG